MKYNSIIIGFGKGGKTLAGYLGKKGEKVALIERSSKMYGGTCINTGCIPSKSLVKNADISNLKESNIDNKERFYEKSVNEKEEVTSSLRMKNYEKIDGIDSVEVIDGESSFIDKNTLKVVTESEELKLEGEKIFINTGSYTNFPKIEGIEDNENVYTSKTLMEETSLPKRLTIVGGGYIGLEFASMYSSFGSEVVILNRSEKLLDKEDDDIAESIIKVLESKNIKILNSASTTKVDGSTVYYEVDGKEEKIENTKIIVATGRRANIKKLNLENAGVEVTKKGLIKVNERLQTTADNIWAMGDVCGNKQFTYISLDDFRIVKSSLENGDYTLDKRKNVPYTVFITPPYSRVGLNEKEAKEKNIEYKLFKMPTKAVPKAQLLQKTDGLMKVLVDKETDKILGAMLFSSEAYEVINIIKLAMDLNADYTILRDMIYTHPTMSEALNELLND